MFKSSVCKRKEYLPYIGVGMVALLVIEVALVALMSAGLVPIPLGRKVATLAWLVSYGLGVAIYAWRQRRTPVTASPALKSMVETKREPGLSYGGSD